MAIEFIECCWIQHIRRTLTSSCSDFPRIRLRIYDPGQWSDWPAGHAVGCAREHRSLHLSTDLTNDGTTMSLQYLKDAEAEGDSEALIRYVRLHFGDGNEKAGAKEIDKAWREALKLLLDVPETDRQFILETVENQSPETLAHLFFQLHFYFVQKSGEWIHDGNL